MPFTAQQTRLAMMIDTHVTQVLADGGGDETLLLSLADHMGTFKQLLETCTSAELNALCDGSVIKIVALIMASATL